jgi:hypothetical protein
MGLAHCAAIASPARRRNGRAGGGGGCLSAALPEKRAGCSLAAPASDHGPQICPLAAFPALAGVVILPAHPVKAVHGRFLARDDGVAPVALRRPIALGRSRRHSAPQARIDRPVDKRRASHPLPQAAFKLASFLRHSSLAQSLVDVAALFQIDRIVAIRVVPKAFDRKAWIERQTAFRFEARLCNTTELA